MWINAEAGRAMSQKACILWDAGDPDARHGKWAVLAFRFIVPAMLQGCMKAIELLGARSIEREEGWPLEFMFREAMIHNLYRTPNVDMKFLASYLVQRRL
jgi:alkylation response protein AidB-like acyl-CoA dehydrogenase